MPLREPARNSPQHVCECPRKPHREHGLRGGTMCKSTHCKCQVHARAHATPHGVASRTLNTRYADSCASRADRGLNVSLRTSITTFSKSLAFALSPSSSSSLSWKKPSNNLQAKYPWQKPSQSCHNVERMPVRRAHTCTTHVLASALVRMWCICVHVAPGRGVKRHVVCVRPSDNTTSREKTTGVQRFFRMYHCAARSGAHLPAFAPHFPMRSTLPRAPIHAGVCIRRCRRRRASTQRPVLRGPRSWMPHDPFSLLRAPALPRLPRGELRKV